MPTDATRHLETTDVCVVGAGPAGLTAALALGSAGHSVALLESGDLHASSDAQALNDGDCEGVPYQGLVRTRHRRVGGTTHLWNVPTPGGPGAKYVPLGRRDLADWPIGWSELEPHYLEAQALCGLGPFEYDAGYWATAKRRPFDLSGTGLESGVYQFGTAERIHRGLVDRIRATQSVSLVPCASAVGLVLEPHRRRALGVRVADARGRLFDVSAKNVVLACGAIENARLLLLSRPDLDGASRWLGRGFMEHARDFSLTLVPESPTLFDAASFYDLHAASDGTWIGGRLSLSDQALASFGLPNAAMTLVPRARTHGRNPWNRMVRRLRRVAGASWGGDRYGWSQRRWPAHEFDAFDIVLNLEQRPQPSNRVELSSRKDPFGNALPRLVLRWSEEEQAVLERLRDLLAEWFRRAHLGELLIRRGCPPDLNAHHHAGTTRMGASPETGVVDADGRVFGLDNLYVAGASVFPTAGFANPTLTIVALALRLARHLDGGLD